MSTGIILPNLDEITSKDRATHRFAQAVELCDGMVRAALTWVTLGRLLTVMERDRDFEELGFKSMGQCMMQMENLSGYKRSSAYAFKKLVEELPSVDMDGMSFGSAKVLQQLPSAMQRDPEVIDAARAMKPKQFRQKLAGEYPDALIEVREELRLNLDVSVMRMWDEFIELARKVNGDPDLTMEQIFELELLGPRLEALRMEAVNANQDH